MKYLFQSSLITNRKYLTCYSTQVDLNLIFSTLLDIKLCTLLYYYKLKDVQLFPYHAQHVFFKQEQISKSFGVRPLGYLPNIVTTNAWCRKNTVTDNCFQTLAVEFFTEIQRFLIKVLTVSERIISHFLYKKTIYNNFLIYSSF